MDGLPNINDPNPCYEGPIRHNYPWTSITLYADMETGEIILSNKPTRYWTPIKREIHYYEHRKRNVREILYLCERTKQTELQFGTDTADGDPTP